MFNQILLENVSTRHNRLSDLLKALLCFFVVSYLFGPTVEGCSPGRSGARRRRHRKLTPLVYKQHVPNVPELSYGASGPSSGRIHRNGSSFRLLVPNYNPDVVFKDEEGTGVDRLMTKRCKERLDILAISVMNQWPGMRLRVTDSWDDDGFHSKDSLHYQGRAVDVTTSDRDKSKYGMLARLAVEAGFDWVFYESRTHIHCSVRSEDDTPFSYGGCFAGDSMVDTLSGPKLMSEVSTEDSLLSLTTAGSLVYSRVLLFLHRDENLWADFIVIETESNRTLKVTRDHRIFVSTKQCRFASKTDSISFHDVMAKDLNVGDFLVTDSLYCDRVKNLKMLRTQGVYAPLTEHGNFLANDIMVSCYALNVPHNLGHLSLLPLRVTWWTLNILETMGLDLKQLKSIIQGRDEDHVHFYANFMYRLANKFGIM